MNKIYFYKEEVEQDLNRAYAIHEAELCVNKFLDSAIYTNRHTSALNINRLERLWQMLPNRPLAQAITLPLAS